MLPSAPHAVKTGTCAGRAWRVCGRRMTTSSWDDGAHILSLRHDFDLWLMTRRRFSRWRWLHPRPTRAVYHDDPASDGGTTGFVWTEALVRRGCVIVISSCTACLCYVAEDEMSWRQVVVTFPSTWRVDCKRFACLMTKLPEHLQLGCRNPLNKYMSGS